MIKDRIMRLLFIPILAIVIPYLSGIFTYHKYSNTGLVLGFIFYLFVSFTLWQGCIWIHTSIRKLYKAEQGPFSKIAMVAFSSSIFTVCLGGIYCLIWFRISLESFAWMPVYKFLMVSIFAVVLFTLIYEILFLSKERELDTKIVNQLDNELNRAEMIALKNELDPHFIYNSLNTLTHLIALDAKKAERYNQKLAQLYKYFLVTNSKELVEAAEEIAFIKEYFGLLQIVYENRMQLSINVSTLSLQNILLIPCSLQLLVENAIKHNQFTAFHPLKICISLEDNFIVVRNTINLKPAVNTTKIGLKNLDAQYRLISMKKIVIEKKEENFMVKLPLIKNSDRIIVNDLSLTG